jgi:hypothetical protein
MAIFKVIIVAAMPFILAPFVATFPSTMTSHVSGLTVSSAATATEISEHKKFNGSTHYKTETGIPHFLRNSVGTFAGPHLYAPDYNGAVLENRKYLEV